MTPHRDNLRELVPGGRGHAVMKTLLDVFIPNNVDYEIIIKPKEEDYTCRLGDKGHPCILGVNARLKSKNSTYESKEQ